MGPVKKNNKPNFLKQVTSFIKEKGLFESGSRILVGVSGGPDSMALLSLLTELRPQWDLTLMVLYCHHGLRPAADEEESFVRAWSKKWACSFFSRKLPVREFQKKTGRSLEDSARELRYEAFFDYGGRKKADRLALAHTADDQAEEVLISLIRGAGLGGLAGMAVKRGQIIRPLIRTYRQEVLDYLAFKKIPFKEDASNRDLRFLRARVRHHLLPELKKYSPQIMAQLNQTAGLLQKDEEYLQEKIDQLAGDLLSFSKTTASFPRLDLAALPQALGSRLIQKALAKGKGHLRHVRAVHLLTILKAVQGNRLKGRISLPDGWAAQWDRDSIKILPVVNDPKPVPPFSYEIERPRVVHIQETGESVSFRKVKASRESFKPPGHKTLASVDFDKVAWPLVIRNVRPGDRFQPLGLRGSKKVSRFFIDRKVPADLRSRIPLVFSRGEIVWIAGMEIGQAFCLDLDSTIGLEIIYGMGKRG